MAQDTEAGAAVYSPLVLAGYDLWVLSFSARFFWRAPSSNTLAMYQRLTRTRHLDVGVGTGYFLDEAQLPPDTHIALLDLNANSLAHTAARLARYRPQTYQRDLLDPFTLPEAPFGSIGMNYLLHCLPGPMARKAVAFDHLLPFLADDGVLFGSTVLADLLPCSWLGTRVSALYNRKGVFSNAADTLPGLQAALEARFTDVTVKAVGTVGYFEARGPRRE